MKTALFLMTALLATVSSSCRSHSNEADIPCRCGTPMADMEGCENPTCRAGKNNPANPDCVCGKLDIPNAKKN